MTKPSVVLFLCTGNYYRSRFAELLFNARAKALGLPWQAESAGLEPNCSARNAGPISRVAVEALTARGIRVPVPYRLPQDVSAHDLEQAGRVIAMKELEHRPLLRARFAAFEPKVEFWNIHDVDQAPPQEALPLIEVRVLELVQSLRAKVA
jgi:protein-tyrosine phosphatase